MTTFKNRGFARLLVAVQDAHLRQAVVSHVQRVRAFDVVFEAADCPTALGAIEQHRPHLLVCESLLPGNPGGGFRVLAAAMDARVPTVMITASWGGPIARYTEHVGAISVCRAAITTDLHDTVDRVLRARDAPESRASS